MEIQEVLCAPGKGGYFQEDLTALQSAPCPTEDRYFKKGITPGFPTIRRIGQALSIGLRLSNGQVFWGDGVGVAYSGKAGREKTFEPEEAIHFLETHLTKCLKGTPLSGFRSLMPHFRNAVLEQENLSPMATCVLYGLSQALLAARAHVSESTMVEVICDEWHLSSDFSMPPLHSQSGRDLYGGADKMLAHRLASLPHGLVDDPFGQIGAYGEKMEAYIRWLVTRIEKFGYAPTIHLDVHGGIGIVFEEDLEKIATFLMGLETAARPYSLRLESVSVKPTLLAQIDFYSQLRRRLSEAGSQVVLVADEWANTLEDIKQFVSAQATHMVQIKMPDLGGLDHCIDAVLLCQAQGTQSLLGGSCNETDLSARVSTHVAMATQPTSFMAKPGMGVVEGIAIVTNEMERTRRLTQKSSK